MTLALNKGFTMAELVVSLGILVLVMVAVYAFEANVFIYTGSSQNQINNVWQAETLLKTMSKELRTMIPSASGSYPIFSATNDSVTFFANVDSDAAIERVRYFFVAASSTMNRGVIQPSGTAYNGTESVKILANGVRASSTLPFFQYFDSTYQGTTSPMSNPSSSISSIRLIKMNLIIDSDPNRSPAVKVFTTSVTPRNIKSI